MARSLVEGVSLPCNNGARVKKGNGPLPTAIMHAMNIAPEDSSPAFRAAQLQLVYSGGTVALDNVNVEVQAGEFVSIVGPSGCGKSTLLKIAAGLLVPSDGSVDIHGGSMGYVFQFPTLLPWRTVLANVGLPLELHRSERNEAAELLRRVGLEGFEHAYPRELSGGMQMRAALARALVTRPDLLLLDEPFGALDAITRHRLNEELLDLWQRDHWAALFITHNVGEAVFLSQRVLVMSPRPGKIVGSYEVPFEFPRSPELRATAAFAELTGRISLRLRESAG